MTHKTILPSFSGGSVQSNLGGRVTKWELETNLWADFLHIVVLMQLLWYWFGDSTVWILHWLANLEIRTFNSGTHPPWKDTLPRHISISGGGPSIITSSQLQSCDGCFMSGIIFLQKSFHCPHLFLLVQELGGENYIWRCVPGGETGWTIDKEVRLFTFD